MSFEIERCALYINRITSKIKNIVKNCEICIAYKLNKYIKPSNVQIISHKPLERVEIDITYFNTKVVLVEI